MHKLLARQLKTLSLNKESMPSNLAQWQTFLDRVNRAYKDADQERYLLERSLQISSREMQERWQALDLEKAKTMHSAKFATLGEMAGSIAHEINNPIGLINLLTGQLQELMEEGNLTPEFLASAIKQIEQSAWRTAKIIKGLRGFSRDGSRDPFVKAHVKKIVDDVLTFCSERFKQHGVELRINSLAPEMVAECREVEVCQVLLNLFNNAFDAVQNTDEKWIELTVSEADRYIELSVTNSGSKISPEVEKRLFQPFFTSKEIGKGTGLGLSISKKIAEIHGGSLCYDSTGAYTRFVFKIAKTQSSQSASVA